MPDCTMPILNSESDDNKPAPSDYRSILEKFGIIISETFDYYIKVGKNSISQGWIFYISIWDIQFYSLLENLIPYLINSKIPFLIPIDRNIHQSIQTGSFGYKNLGKIISILPNNEADIVTIAEHLITITKDYKGTPVPIAFLLGNIVYTRYGSFNSIVDTETYIINYKGEKLKDEESIPPQNYTWAYWPFFKITKETTYNNEKRILNQKYLIKKIIKPDIKGKVVTALYSPKLFTFKICIIKEGIKGMGVDDNGRDITDRLSWQNILHNKLYPIIKIPSIIDSFDDENSCFLVLEFLKGKSLGEFLMELYHGRSWSELSEKEMEIILNILIKVVDNVRKMHNEGYIHRDLNSENIFIDNKQEIWLLDLELTYDLFNHSPNPPYEGGTQGYMSPEQRMLQIPTVEQDIYSLGAIFSISLLHIAPGKLDTKCNSNLRDQISFFNTNPEIISLISNCLSHEKIARPNIESILETLRNLKVNIKKNHALSYTSSITKIEVSQALKKALQSLILPSMINSQGYWSSTLSTTESFIGNARLDRTIYTGLRKGVSGVLYTIGEAYMAELDVSILKQAISVNYDLISYSINSENAALKTGLFNGSYGMAVGLYSLMKSNLISNNIDNQNLLTICFQNTPDHLNIADGVSGYGIALLKCRSLLNNHFVNARLKTCVTTIINRQKSNGCWHFLIKDDKNEIITGFTHGMAGIIWFLLSYSEIYDDKDARTCGIKGLNFLLKKIIKINDIYTWNLAINRDEIQDFTNGGYQTLLPFIIGYKITKNKQYKEIVENVLNGYPKHLVSNMFSLERGIAGLGEIYLEAWQTFQKKEWYERAEWLAGVLVNMANNIDNYTYWLQDDPFYPHADLLTGHCGIIHFLLRFAYNDKVASIY